MRLLSNLQVKGKPAVLPDRAIRGQSHYFIHRPRTMGTESLPAVKWPGRRVDHPPQSSAEVKERVMLYILPPGLHGLF